MFFIFLEVQIFFFVSSIKLLFEAHLEQATQHIGVANTSIRIPDRFVASQA